MLRATSHTRLKARDHFILRSLIGPKMFYEQTLYSLRPSPDTGVLLLLSLVEMVEIGQVHSTLEGEGLGIQRKGLVEMRQPWTLYGTCFYSNPCIHDE